jgi:hypothetical protein
VARSTSGGFVQRSDDFKFDALDLLGRSSCAYRKSHPAILMVQSALDRAADNSSGPLGAARERGILVQ